MKGETSRFYDVKLSGVSVGRFDNDPSGNGVETAVAFDFSKRNLTVAPPAPTGRPGTPQAAGSTWPQARRTRRWGFVTSAVDTTMIIRLASAATPVPADSPLHYILKGKADL